MENSRVADSGSILPVWAGRQANLWAGWSPICRTSITIEEIILIRRPMECANARIISLSERTTTFRPIVEVIEECHIASGRFPEDSLF